MKSFRIQLIAMFIMVIWSLDVIPHFWERPPPEYVYKYHFGLEVESEDDSDWTICILRSQYPFNSTELEEFAEQGLNIDLSNGNIVINGTGDTHFAYSRYYPIESDPGSNSSDRGHPIFFHNSTTRGSKGPIRWTSSSDIHHSFLEEDEVGNCGLEREGNGSDPASSFIRTFNAEIKVFELGLHFIEDGDLRREWVTLFLRGDPYAGNGWHVVTSSGFIPLGNYPD